MRCFILILFLVTGLITQAQKGNFEEGYLVTKTGDTLYGQVNWKKNPGSKDSLLYRSSASAPTQYFSWNRLSEVYNKDDNKSLKIASVMRNYEYIDDRDYMIRYKDSVGMQIIPLTPLYKGTKLSLYIFYENAPFYFIYDGKEMKQLVQVYRYTNTGERMFDYEKGRRFHITDVYRGTLAAYYNFAEDNKMRYMLNNTLYEQSSLQTLISKMDKKLR
jgi:hypothetical protein